MCKTLHGLSLYLYNYTCVCIINKKKDKPLNPTGSKEGGTWEMFKEEKGRRKIK